MPPDIKKEKRYSGVGPYTVSEVAKLVKKEFGQIDFLVHSLANAPEVKNMLIDTSRAGYLSSISTSSYSLTSLVKHFGPLMPFGGSVVSMTYIASERVTPGYGGGMSAAKAALESDTKTLAWEAGRRWGLRLNCISAGHSLSFYIFSIPFHIHYSFLYSSFPFPILYIFIQIYHLNSTRFLLFDIPTSLDLES